MRIIAILFYVFLCEVDSLVVRITEIVRIAEGTENAENAEKATLTSILPFVGDRAVRKTISSFRVLCVFGAFRDSDGKEIRITELNS
ncbi:hypothetical protein C6499_06830 [Candidatus Poribacteria bacterium]|nr:MAG: hypothetical protein C6499_06830 [Candidatus Poribacteria bacterium]